MVVYEERLQPNKLTILVRGFGRGGLKPKHVAGIVERNLGHWFTKKSYNVFSGNAIRQFALEVILRKIGELRRDTFRA